MSVQSTVLGNAARLPRGDILDQSIPRRDVAWLAGLEARDPLLDPLFESRPRFQVFSKTSRNEATKPCNWASAIVTGGAN